MNTYQRLQGMTIKIFLVGICVVGVLNASEQACCVADQNAEQFCYIGSLDFKLKGHAAQQFDLCYDGMIIPVNNSIYCFKENKDVEKFYVLFIDPDAINSISKHNENNTLDYLTFISSTPYHFYQFKRIQESQDTYSWQIKRKPMSKKERTGHTIVIIPDHTLIIPIENQFFKKAEQSSILFTYKALKSEGDIIKLPSPVISDYDKEDLQDALLKANVCMIHLKNIHAKQSMHVINLDKRQLIQ